jgi:hypothetical protein
MALCLQACSGRGGSIFYVDESRQRLGGPIVEQRFVTSTHALAMLRARKRRQRDIGDRGDLGELRDEAPLDRGPLRFGRHERCGREVGRLWLFGLAPCPCPCPCIIHNALTLLVILRQPDLEHMRHTIDIDTTSEDVRSEHDTLGGIPKFLRRLVPLLLRQPTVHHIYRRFQGRVRVGLLQDCLEQGTPD